MVPILLGCLMVTLTTLVHLGFMLGILRTFHLSATTAWRDLPGWHKAWGLSALIVCMVIASLIEAAMWALLYRLLGVIPTIEDAMYFSTVTYATLGYGDITLDGRWRLVSGIQAANGTIMFGWTTALIVMAMSRLYLEDEA